MRQPSFPCAWLTLLPTTLVLLSMSTARGSEENRYPLPAAAETTIDFSEHIEPIFRARCYSCHAGDAQEAGLRLDLRDRALQGGDSGAAIMPGDAHGSPLLLRVAAVGDLGRMPPEGEGRPLSDEEVGRLRAWIEQGAEWPAETNDARQSENKHWAFQPIIEPNFPGVDDPSWLRNGIDAFILRKLQQKAVGPSPEADRATLIRRVYLDVIGLPPAPGQWKRWMHEPSDSWYDMLVDYLLHSPHYGERWGRHWLDLARYADSDGFEKDSPRPHAWRWRDWVIRSLNEDKAFDEFTTEQLAGDLLPNSSLEQRVATGFHRNTLINREGGTDPEEDRTKRTVDRTNTLGKVWLAMTLECAQCHTHKYDPITQREYYQMYAFFNSLREPNIGAPLPRKLKEYKAARAAFDRQHAVHTNAMKQYEEEELSQAFAQWLAHGPDASVEWFTLEPARVTAKQGTQFQVLPDRSVLATGENPGRAERYTIVFDTDLSGITGVRLEAMADDRLPQGGPGRGADGNFLITQFTVTAAPTDGSAPAQDVVLANARSDHAEPGGEAKLAINTSDGNGWSIAPDFGRTHTAAFETEKPVGFSGGTRLTVTIQQSNTRKLYHNVGRFRISVTTRSDEQPPLAGMTDLLARALETPAEQRSAIQHKRLLAYYRRIDPELQRLRAAAREHEKEAPANPFESTKAQVVAELRQPRETHILERGDFLQPGARVTADTPAVLPPLSPGSDQRPDRLDLARWLVSEQHPLTARVTVNRVWARFFGRGLVASLDDFGSQGRRPSHPELLDWLAYRFRADGWSLKRLQRLIVTSATYRQSSAARPELRQRDPLNTWLSHQNRLRVEAEVVRDVALAASGLIQHRLGGPSVRPPQPEGVAMLGYAGSVKWKVSEGADRYRRGLYTFFQRTVPYPMLIAFDAPDSNLSCTRRERSNTPIQALTMWNDPVMFECAQALGSRIMQEIPAGPSNESTTDDRIRHGFRLCLARDPSPQDLEVVRELFHTQLELAAQDERAARLVAGRSDIAPAEAAELAAWVVVGRTLMNLDEFITRQ